MRKIAPEIKIAEGNRSKAKIKPSPQSFEKEFTCPTFVNPAGKKEWKRLYPLLQQMRILDAADRSTLAAYCDCYGKMVTYAERLKKEDHIIETTNGNIIQNPLCGLQNTTQTQLLKYINQLGLSPAARMSLAVDKPEKKDDPLLKMLNKKRA